MNTSPPDLQKNYMRQAAGWLGAALFHVAGVAVVAAVAALLVLPFETVEMLASVHLAVPQVMGNSAPAFFLHIGLSACMWALLVIIYKLWKHPRPQRVHALGRRGSVMTETLIVLPIFLLMTLGLAQLAVNNVAGILANVAVYEAARTAWLWTPEEGVERVSGTVDAAAVKDRARIAAALVMTPAAPGEFLTDPISGTDQFKKTRFAMAASHVPGGGAFQSLGELLSTAFSFDMTRATERNMSLSRALDESTFIERGLLKFTHAYTVTDIEVTQSAEGRIGVKLTYHHHQAMPYVRRLYGTFKMSNVGLRAGYYVEYTREYSFKAQEYPANAALPDNGFGGNQMAGGGGSAKDAVRGQDEFEF